MLGFYSTSFSLKNIMVHGINKSWIEKTLIEGLKSLEFGKITFNPNKDYAQSRTSYPLPFSHNPIFH